MITKKVKLCIFEKHPYSFLNEKDGKTYTGFLYIGLTANGQVIRFTSKKDEYKESNLDGYEESKAIDITLYGNVQLNGSLKYTDYEKERKPIEGKGGLPPF